MSTDRRLFLRRTLAISAAAAWCAAGGPPLRASVGTRFSEPADAIADREADGMPPIIDTHVHLWDLSRFRLPWLESSNPLARSFLVDDYRKAAEGLGVVRTVYMEVDVDPTQHVAEAESILDLCRRRVGLLGGAVIGGRPAAAEFRGYLDRFRNAPEVKGLRQVLHGAGTPSGYCLDPRFQQGVRLLGERGLSFDLCMRPGELRDADRLVAACPDTLFILDHCGNPNVRDPDRTAWRPTSRGWPSGRTSSARSRALSLRRLPASGRPGTWRRSSRTSSRRSARPGRLRGRLARVYESRHAPPVGRGAAGDRPRPPRDRAAKAVP